MAATPARKKVLAVVLAGGEGKRLMPLTADRAKPAVPFGGIYRLIDFALSNVVNSGYLKVVVLTQYKSHSLDRHVTTTWRMSNLLGNYVTPVPAQQRVGKRWYLGSADAIYQSLNLLTDEQPDIVVVVGADHVYRMDFSQMVADHVESGAGCTVAAIRQPIGLADQFGVIDVDPGNPQRIRAFLEKPTDPVGLPDSPDEVLASMGNYVFTADALRDAVTRDAELEGSKHDMGGDIVPWFVDKSESSVYDYKDNEVPGSTDRDRGYWRDVGTMRSYYDAHMDLVSPLPVFNLYNNAWPIYTSYGPHPPAKLVEGASGAGVSTFNSILSPGVVVSGGTVNRSVLSPAAWVKDGAEVSDSVLMDGVQIGEGAVVRNAIIDKGVVVPPGTRIGVDQEEDRPGASSSRRPHRARQAAGGPEDWRRAPPSDWPLGRYASSTSLRHAAIAWSYAARAASGPRPRQQLGAHRGGRWLAGTSTPSSAASPAAGPCSSATATARASRAPGEGATAAAGRRARRCAPTGCPRARARACSAAIRAWSAYDAASRVTGPARPGWSSRPGGLGDLVVVPAGAVLVGQQHQPAVGTRASRRECCRSISASRPTSAGSSGRTPEHDPHQPDRLAGRLGAQQVGAGAGRVAGGEREVGDLGDGVEPLREHAGVRHAEGDARARRSASSPG